MEAKGKVTGVEDGMATIEYEISAAVELDDLMTRGRGRSGGR